jgi:hypothetical protein
MKQVASMNILGIVVNTLILCAIMWTGVILYMAWKNGKDTK